MYSVYSSFCFFLTGREIIVGRRALVQYRGPFWTNESLSEEGYTVSCFAGRRLSWVERFPLGWLPLRLLSWKIFIFPLDDSFGISGIIAVLFSSLRHPSLGTVIFERHDFLCLGRFIFGPLPEERSDSVMKSRSPRLFAVLIDYVCHV